MISEDAINPRLARIGRPVPPLVSGAARAAHQRARTWTWRNLTDGRCGTWLSHIGASTVPAV